MLEYWRVFARFFFLSPPDTFQRVSRALYTVCSLPFRHVAKIIMTHCLSLSYEYRFR